METETIIVADDHPVFRDGLCALIARERPQAVVVAVEDFEGVLRHAEREPPALFILDLYFARRSIVDELEGLRRRFPSSAIVVVSMAQDRSTVHAAMTHGINGFLNKSLPPHQIMSALRDVYAGAVVVRLPEDLDAGASASCQLSPRQLDMLRHIAEGRSNKEIALALGISPFTVRIHVSALFRSLGVNGRAAAVTKAVSEGILAPR